MEGNAKCAAMTYPIDRRTTLCVVVATAPAGIVLGAQSRGLAEGGAKDAAMTYQLDLPVIHGVTLAIEDRQQASRYLRESNTVYQVPTRYGSDETWPRVIVSELIASATSRAFTLNTKESKNEELLCLIPTRPLFPPPPRVPFRTRRRRAAGARSDAPRRTGS